MILKASQRGGGKQLALHLLNDTDNEHVELHDMRGFVSDNLVGAMKEAYAVSKGTRCKQFLFSISLNPPETEDVPPAIFEDALSRIEAKTGLDGQPRAVVFHEKEGRRHCHAVYSRIDAERMTAINMSHFKLKLRDVSRELYLKNDWRMPKGLMNSEARDPRNYTLAEYQQAKRMGLEGRDLKATMQECWAASDSAAAFKHALKERGMTLAKGDRRGHVAVTHDGEVLPLSRYTGKRVKDIRARLGEPDSLPSVDQAKTAAARGMSATMTRHIGEANTQHRRAMAPLEQRRTTMVQAHRDERRKQEDGQKARWRAETLARSQRLNKGLRGLWDRLSGHYARTQRQNIAEAHAALKRDRDQRQALIADQITERRRLQAEIKAMRTQHAELLRELRTDRQEQRAKLRETERVPAKAKVSTKQTAKHAFERAAQTHVTARVSVPPKVTPEPQRLRQSFEKSTVPKASSPQHCDRPDMADRLQRLQDGNTRPDRGHDLER